MVAGIVISGYPRKLGMGFGRLVCILAIFASSGNAESPRQLGAHEHGVGQLDIAVEGSQIALVFDAPGADIVGFEYEATTEADEVSVEKALAALERPLEVFVFSSTAKCSVLQSRAELMGGDKGGHVGHDHSRHVDKKRGHKPKESGRDNGAVAGHTEFNAEYLLECADIPALEQIDFYYFDLFPNALSLDVNLISDKGATAHKIGRDSPVLDLRDQI